MSSHYLKRYRLEIDLRDIDLPAPVLPEGYLWQPWSPRLSGPHAEVTVAAFQDSPDGLLFPRLVDARGCRDLVDDIASHPCFVPEATWLIEFAGSDFSGPIPVGAIQGLGGVSGTGAIQNVAVIPAHQNFGLGRALLVKSLTGFAELRLFRVTLEVSASNRSALHLYEGLGFRHEQTRFRPLPEAKSPPVQQARAAEGI